MCLSSYFPHYQATEREGLGIKKQNKTTKHHYTWVKHHNLTIYLEVPRVKEFLNYKNITFGMQLSKTYKSFLAGFCGFYKKKYLHATVEVNLLYSLWNELVVCSAFRSIFYYFTSVEKHVNSSLNLTRIGPHQEINEVEPVNRIDWFVHGYLMNWFNPASAAKKKTHLAQPITLNNHFTNAGRRMY